MRIARRDIVCRLGARERVAALILGAITIVCLLWIALLRLLVAPPGPWVTPEPDRTLPPPTAVEAPTGGGQDTGSSQKGTR